MHRQISQPSELAPHPFANSSLFLSHRTHIVDFCLTERGSPTAEAFRLLGVRLRHLRRQRPIKTLLITSTIPEEGKSLVAANLACAVALSTHERSLLLEGDLRRPSLSQKFGLGRNPGLCECLKGERSLASSIYRTRRCATSGSCRQAVRQAMRRSFCSLEVLWADG